MAMNRRGHHLILYEQHRDRIKNMKSDVDDKAPPSMPKSFRAEIERRQKESLIELDNRILLDRLAQAMKVKNIDNERKKVNFISLMEGKKKRDNSRIEVDNRRLLHSIQHTVPVYNHIMWERQAANREHVLKNMTQFPELFEKRRKEESEKKKEMKAKKLSQDSSLLYKLDDILAEKSSSTKLKGGRLRTVSYDKTNSPNSGISLPTTSEAGHLSIVTDNGNDNDNYN